MKAQNILLENLKTVADAFAKHNGDDCEVCIHDLKSKDTEHTIVYIVNNHVTGRKVGDSLSFSYLKNRKLLEEGKKLENRLLFYSHTYDGKHLKCSTIYLKDEKGEYRYMLCINQDVSKIIQANKVLEQISNSYDENESAKEEHLSLNVSNILEELINNSIKFIGKTPAYMTTEEKKAAIKFLNDAGAFLITKSGDRVSEFFQISKFTLYSYISDGKEEPEKIIHAKENKKKKNTKEK